MLCFALLFSLTVWKGWASQLLSNGGFESASGGQPDAWATYGGSLSQVSSPIYAGSYAGKFSSASLSQKWAYQTVQVTGGNPYVFSGYIWKNDSNVEWAALRISWYSSLDGTGSKLSDATGDLLTADTPQFVTLSLTVTAPLLARSARAQVVLQPRSGEEAAIYLDDLALEGEVYTPTPTPSATPTPTATYTPSPTPTPTPTPTATPLPSPTPTSTPTAAPTPTATPAPSPTPSPTPTITPSPTATAQPTHTATSTPPPTPTVTPSPTATNTATPQPTDTPTPSPTATATALSTPSPTPTSNPTATVTATPAATATSPAATLGSQTGGILINEVLVDPAQSPESEFEWVELYNPSPSPVSLSGWSVADNFSSKPLPAVVMAAKSYLVVTGKASAFYSTHPSFAGALVEVSGGRIGNGLSNSADMVVLKDAEGTVIDSVNWGRPNSAWPNFHSRLQNPGPSPPPTGQTLGRLGTQDYSTPGSWVVFLSPSPGNENPSAQAVPTPTTTLMVTPQPTATPTAQPTATATPSATPSPLASLGSVHSRTASASPLAGVTPAVGGGPASSRPLAQRAPTPTAELSPAGVGPRSWPTRPLATIGPRAPAAARQLGLTPSQAAAPGVEGTPTPLTLPQNAALGRRWEVILLIAIPLVGLAWWLKTRLFP